MSGGITPFQSPTEPYFPVSTGASPDPPRGTRAISAVRAPSTLVEASQLLVDGQRLLQESRASEAEPLLLRALVFYEQRDDFPSECIHVFSDLASIATARGDLSGAESLLQRGLALANARFGSDHPDLATMLGGLARLYLRRSDYTKAEPVLQRLLEIRRARGEEHPEVATVLASLATARSAMGAHESAERLLRRVLAIREKTLAPNHFATMTTLEHLAESCAARGKLNEALVLLNRALAMRERTLGASHPSVAITRTRIADLELVSSNEELGSATMSSPMMAKLRVIDTRPDELVDADAPPVREAVSSTEAALRTVPDANYDDWEDEPEKPRSEGWLSDRFNAGLALVTGFTQTPRGRVIVLAIGVTSLLAALVVAVRTRAQVAVTPAGASLVSSQAGSSARSGPASAAAPEQESIALPAPISSRRLTTASDVASRSVAATRSARPSARAEPHQRDTENDSALMVLPKAIKIGAFETAVHDGPVGPARAPLVASADFARSGVSRIEATTPGDAADRVRGRVAHPVLPADNPAPQYPPDLMRRQVEGRVVAEFLVDAKGRVDTRTLRIISSTDDRFSQAVRDVLPNLRFLPAERDGVKTEEWVEMPFRFSPKSASAR